MKHNLLDSILIGDNRKIHCQHVFWGFCRVWRFHAMQIMIRSAFSDLLLELGQLAVNDSASACCAVMCVWMDSNKAVLGDLWRFGQLLSSTSKICWTGWILACCTLQQSQSVSQKWSFCLVNKTLEDSSDYWCKLEQGYAEIFWYSAFCPETSKASWQKQDSTDGDSCPEWQLQ